MLTEWQCSKLLQGKWKGFWVDGKFKLLDQPSGEEAKYVAEEYGTRRIVTILIKPSDTNPQGIDYELLD